MADKHFKQVRKLFVLFLSAVMLTACITQKTPETGQNSGTYGQSPGIYDQNQADTSNAQSEFDRLTQDLFKKEISRSNLDLHYTLADPSTRQITNVPNTFGDYSLGSIKKDFDDMRALLKELQDINIQKLSKDQKVTYKILTSYLETELSAEGMELYAQPLTSTIGVQAQLPVLLAEYPFYARQDVDNYLELLSSIDTYYGQLLEFEQQKSAAGLFMCDTAADHVLESCEAYLIQPDHSFLSETFNERIDGLEGLNEDEKKAYKDQNLKILEEHFIPAYKTLINGITALMGTGQNEKGLCFYPQGKEYFEYLVRSNTGTSYESIPKLKKAIEQQMSLDLEQMGQIVNTDPTVLDTLDTYQFRYTKPEEILEALKSMIAADFPELPESAYAVKYVPTALENSLSPAFYLVPPLDRYEDNVIYINGGERFKGTDLFPTLAHEGYPGHLYQNVYFLSHNKCDLRNILSFPCYSEGWATYVEHYSYTLDNGLGGGLGNLLAHNSAATLGLYALLDININYEGWGKEQVAGYLEKVFGLQGNDVVDSVYYSLVENPTNYMEYYVGYLEIMEMRNTAQKILKDQFDLKEFHTFLLDLGPAQFTIIQPYFRLWLADQMNDQEK